MIDKVDKIVYSILAVIVILSAFASMIPTAQSTGNSMGNSAKCDAINDITHQWNGTTATDDCSYNSVTDKCNWHKNLTAPVTECNGYTTIVLSGLFSGTGIAIMFVMIGAFMAIFLYFKERKK